MLLGADQSIARKYNRAQILNRLRVQGAASRADLARQTGLTRSTISRIIDDLMEEKLVHEISENQNSFGRPGTLLALNPSGGSAIGMEIGVHFISIMLTDFASSPLWNDRIEINDSIDSDIYISKAEALITKAISISEQKKLSVKGIGVAIWGMVNYQTHSIHFAPNLSWRDISLESRWGKLFNVPVIIENDANAAALGEYYFGNGQGIDDFIYLSMDIGVGSGIMSKGRLFRGVSGYAGEIGHVTINQKGTLCNCGKRGCLETEIGRHIIIERYRKLTSLENIPLEHIIERGQAGDPIARKIFDDAGVSIGLGICSAINLLNPGAIIFGWSLGEAYNLFLPAVQRTLREKCSPGFYENLQLKPSRMGSNDAVYGSIALVLDEIIRETIY